MQHFKLCNFLKCSRKARWTGVGNTSRIYIESWWKKFRWHSRPEQQGWRRSSAGHPSSWPGWACRSGASSVWWWGSSSCLNPCGAPGSHPCSYHRVEQPMWPESHTPASTLPADRGRGRTNIPWCADTLTCLNVPNPDRADIVLTTDWQCTPSCSIFVYVFNKLNDKLHKKKIHWFEHDSHVVIWILSRTFCDRWLNVFADLLIIQSRGLGAWVGKFRIFGSGISD